MGKSSSSSSDSSDYEWKHLNKHEKKQMKKWKKKMKKGKIPYGTPPPIAISGYAGPHFAEEDCPEHHPDTEVPEFQQEPEDEGTEADNEEEHVEEEEEDAHHEHSGGEEEKDKHKKKHKDTDTDDGEGTVTLDGHAEDFTPAVVDAEGFSAEKDAEALRQAMRGAGTNEQSLIDIVGHRSANQRQEIEITYKTMFGKDLLDDIESELSGEFRELMMGLFKPPAYYDAWCLHEAMVGAGTKDNILIEILCTRTNDQIAAIASTYKEQFGCELEEDITDDTSGEFKRLMVSSCQGHRSELSPDQLDQVRSEGWESVIDHDQATEDAQRLYDAGENRLGTDESTFLQILAMRNYYQLRGIFEEYEKIAGCDLLESISSEMSGNFEDGLRALVRSARNRPEYFADKLHNALSGLGTKDTRLIRIIISRSEIDLKDIQQAFLDKYEQDLAAMIESDTSGDYKQLLLAIINN